MGTVIVTDLVFKGYIRRGMDMQQGALCDVVGCMRAFPGCDEVLMQSAKSELARFRRGTAAFMSGRAKDFEPLDRPLLARAWADWHVAQGVRDYGWVDYRVAAMALPDGYSVAVRYEQEGIRLSLVDDRNPKYPAVVGSCQVDTTGTVWIGRHGRRAESPAAGIATILAEHEQFEASREAQLTAMIGAA